LKSAGREVVVTRSELDIMMKPKFELPESIFNVTKGFPNKYKQPRPITQTPPVKANKPFQEQLNFLINLATVTESNSQKSLKMAGWTIIIVIIAIIFSVV